VDEIEMLRQYGARLDSQSPPNVDVSRRVLETVRRGSAANDWSSTAMRPFAYAAAAGWLIAVTCGLFAQQAWMAIDDPLGALISPLTVSLQ